MYHTIMVPLDGSSFGEYALPLALGIARCAGARVELVHVCTPLGPNVFGAALDAPVLGETRLSQMRERARAYISHLATCLSERWEIAITTAVLEGPAADTLYDHACASGADLAVMTTHGYGPLGRAWMGSVADTLVRRLPMPLLLARPHAETLDLLESVHERPFAHVVIPLDGSALAEEAIAPALALGQLMAAEYTLLEAIEAPVLGYAPAAQVVGLDERVPEQWRAEALARLERLAGRMRERGAVAHSVVAYGPPAVTIIEYARHHAADLIALTTHGRSGAVRLLLGSVADKIVRGAGVPVLIQRSREQDERTTPII
jgi:nucleotide-binding universal stress UspA family protein